MLKLRYTLNMYPKFLDSKITLGLYVFAVTITSYIWVYFWTLTGGFFLADALNGEPTLLDVTSNWWLLGFGVPLFASAILIYLLSSGSRKLTLLYTGTSLLASILVFGLLYL